jgi:hypothetical protein
MKIRIANALTNPVSTLLETKRIRAPSFNRPHPTCNTPASTVAASRYCRPKSRTSVTIRTAVAAVAAEIMPGRPPRIAVSTAIENDA